MTKKKETIGELLPLDNIDIGNRFRNNLGDLTSLKESIKEVGLINPITVVDKIKHMVAGNEIPKGHALEDSKTMLLLAGERRFVAVAELVEEGFYKKREIKAIVLSPELSHEKLRVVELVENIARKDMEWHEKDELIAEIHRIRTADKGVTLPGSKAAEEKVGHSMSDTAELLNISTAQVSRAIKRSDAMDRVPEMAVAKSANEADKILKRQLRQLAIEELNRRRTKKEGGLKEQKQRLIDNFIIGDALKGMKALENESVDFYEIDPPYGTEYPNLVKDKTSIFQYAETKDFPALIQAVMPEVSRTLKENRWGVLWFGIQYYQTALEAILDAGLSVNTTPLLWEKPNGSTNNPQYIMPSAYETGFYFRKGNAELRKVPGKNILFYNRVPEKWRIHPTERPIAMLMELFSFFVAEGSTIVSPFLGSGATILAAHNSGMQCMGWDKQKQYKERHTHRVLSQTGPKFLASLDVPTGSEKMSDSLKEAKVKFDEGI